MNDPQEIYIPPNFNGQRLDNILFIVFPELSLRARRRLWDSWHIYIDDRAEGPGYRVYAGQKLSLIPKPVLPTTITLPTTNAPRVIQELNDLLFIYKPSGLHSVKLEQGSISLEDYLPLLLQANQKYKLCNRLDAQTSGIIVVAKNDSALLEWQELENNAQCQKHYIALVQGKAKDCIIDVALDTDKRKKSKVLPHTADPIRHTHFQVLTKVDEQSYAILRSYFTAFPKSMPHDLYFVGCSIWKGARHQIRAHANYAGFPLFNDLRYQENTYTAECFVLHNTGLTLPHANIYCDVPWSMAAKGQLSRINKG